MDYETKETPRAKDVDNEFFAEAPQISSFECELATSSARMQSTPTWSVVTVHISCEFLRAVVEEDDGRSVFGRDTVMILKEELCRTRKAPTLWQYGLRRVLDKLIFEGWLTVPERKADILVTFVRKLVIKHNSWPEQSPELHENSSGRHVSRML